MNITDEGNAKTRSHKDAEKIENILAAKIIDAAIEVHLLVESKVIIEVKATEQAVHRAQVLTYLRLTGLKLGLLLNFGQKLLRDGIERVVNDL